MSRLILFFILLTSLVEAKPLFEWGAAFGGGYVPDYAGADQGRQRFIAFPSFLYRGKILKNDRRGTRALFISNKSWDFDFSFGASFPLRSKNNDAREGMSDLDWVFEIGPRLTRYFIKNDKRIFAFELPLRFALSTDFQYTRERGQRMVPQIDYREFLNLNWRWGMSYRLNYATEQLNDYIYQVETRDVTSERAAFNAQSGYVGQSLSTSIVYRNDYFIGIMGMSYSQYHNSINQDSPLLRRKNNSAIFIAFNYFFYQSTEQGISDKNGEY